MDNKTYLANAQQTNRNEWKSADGSSTRPINMLYLRHNLPGNYHNASGMGDEDMKADILMSEIAKLIVHRTDEVASALNKHGVKTSKNPTHRELVGKVSGKLHMSKEFAKDIALLIVGKPRPKKMNAEGGGQASTQDYAAMAAGTASLISSIGGMFGGKKKAKAQAKADKATAEAAARAKAAAQAQLQNAVKGVSGGKDTGMSVSTYILIGLGSAAALGGIIYGIVKYRNRGKA